MSAARTRRHQRGPGWRLAALALCALALLLAPRAQAQEPPPDLATYAGWLREAHAAAQRGDRLGLEQVAGRITATTSVRLPDGGSSAVENGWLRDELDQAEPDLQVIGERLGAIIDALAQPDSSAPEDARARLRDILSRPPFARRPPPETPGWLDALFEWLGRVLESLLRPIGSVSPSAGHTIGWVFATIGLLLVLGLVVYLLLNLRRSMAREARADADDPEANLTAKTALEQAGDLARGGDYRTAVRYLYLSALLWLDERDILRYDRALTNREYLDRVRENAALRARLAPIVETFDRVWYGHATLDAESFATYRAQVEALRDEGARG